MFVAPPEKEVEWTDAGLEGSFRFLARVWRLVDPLVEALAGAGRPDFSGLALDEADRGLRRKTHETIQRVTDDLDKRVHLNTAVSAMMELVNELYAYGDQKGAIRVGRRAEEADGPLAVARRETVAVLKEAVESLLLMLSPFAPHMSEELWSRLGHADGVTAAGWPAYDAEVARPEEVVLPVQVNGKVRARITASAGATDAELEALALAHPHVQAHVAGKTVGKVVIVKGRLIGVVAK
jgi:leucyl-tRNA synthetase